MATPPERVAVMRIEREIELLRETVNTWRGAVGFPRPEDIKNMARADGMYQALTILLEEIG